MVQTNEVESIRITAGCGWIAEWFDVSEDDIDVRRFKGQVGAFYEDKYPDADVRVDIDRYRGTEVLDVDVNGQPQEKNTDLYAVDTDRDWIWHYGSVVDEAK